MSSLKELKSQWLADPAFSQAYEAIEPEFNLAKTLIEARVRLGISQTEVALRMHTKQSVVARLEANGASPNLATLKRYADAVGCKLNIFLSPQPAQPRSLHA